MSTALLAGLREANLITRFTSISIRHGAGASLADTQLSNPV